ncbi:sialidase family protein [Aeoliella sp. SH292]|uniref:sialidase family protein n=1 Tax=Aeoliella sp. SH292 TaxID=3454464 RepID=UPI003F9B83B6
MHADTPGALDYTTKVTRHFACPEDAFWFQARATAIPNQRSDSGRQPSILLTMQPHGFEGTHNYKGIVSSLTNDFGRNWQFPTAHKELDIRTRPREENGRSIYEVPVDATPMYHPQTGKVILTGATFQVDTKTNKDVPGGTSDVFYAAYDPKTHAWSQWTTLEFPASFPWPYKRTGCCQALVEPNGDVLLPIYFGEHNNSIHYATIARCKFDGEKLSYVEHGSEHKLDFGRGMSEPSLAKFEGQYFMTMRNDQGAYVSTSSDGLRFSEAEPWRFDDGEELGSYNTQQHFLTHSDGLFLVYTRRGLDNDDVMRHRAPLVMAQIDPQTRRVLRDTERIVVPKEGSEALGNFGVCNITPNISWIVVAKRVTTPGEKNVLVAQIEWNRPNLLVND